MLHKYRPTVVTFVPAPTEAALDLYRSLERQTWQELKDSVGKRTAVDFTFPDELARFRSGFADPQVPAIVHDVLVAVAFSGISASVFQLLKTWVKARNGRKLKIKVGDVEVDATQMKEADLLRIFELLEEKADRKKIRDALMEAGKGGRTPDAL